MKGLTLDASDTQPIDKVLCEPKGYSFGCFECFPLKFNLSKEAPAEVYEKQTLSNKQLKSTCTVSPVLLSRRMFSQ